MRNHANARAILILLGLLPCLAAAADLPDASRDACQMVHSAANNAAVQLPFQTVEGRLDASRVALLGLHKHGRGLPLSGNG